MKRNNTTLILLWSGAGLSLVAGVLLTLQSLNGIPRLTELWAKQDADIRTLSALRNQSARHRAILSIAAGYPATATRLEDLGTAGGRRPPLTFRVTDTRPAVEGWTTRKVSVDLTDLTGEELGSWLAAGAAARPPWALAECTLFSASTPGRIAKASLIMVTAERTTGN